MDLALDDLRNLVLGTLNTTLFLPVILSSDNGCRVGSVHLRSGILSAASCLAPLHSSSGSACSPRNTMCTGTSTPLFSLLLGRGGPASVDDAQKKGRRA